MKTTKKIIAAILAVITVVCTLGISVFAKNVSPKSLPDGSSNRTLTIYKSEDEVTEDENNRDIDLDGATKIAQKQKFENIEFYVYKVDSLNGSNTDVKPSNTTIDQYKNTAPDFILTTDANGKTETKAMGTGDKDGKYLIIEKDNPAIAKKAAPFYVNIPYTNADGTEWIYDVVVYPKNEAVPGPQVNKDVVKLDNKSATFDMDDKQTWIVRCDVPEDIAYMNTAADANTENWVYAKNYKVTDVLDTRLDYQGGLICKLYTTSGSEVAIDVNDTNFIVSAPAVGSNGTLTITLTNAAKKFIANNVGDRKAEGAKTPELRFYFDTSINNTAVLAKVIPNDTTLDYTNSLGKVYAPATVENKPEVHTFGFSIHKFDKADTTKALAGAEFTLYAAATSETTGAVHLQGDFYGIPVDFYTSETITAGSEGAFTAKYANKVSVAKTDENGNAILAGLAAGTYYLVETKAPVAENGKSYTLLSAPVVVTIADETSENGVQANAHIENIANSLKFILPVTGGTGTVIFSVVGTLCVAAAVVLLMSKKKKNIAE